MEQHRIEESVAIEELEISMKQLKLAYVAVFNKFTRIAKNPDLKINLSHEEFDELDKARRNFDVARAQMDKISEQIRVGTRT